MPIPIEGLAWAPVGLNGLGNPRNWRQMMRRILFSLALLCALAILQRTALSAITIATVPVGNVNNPADTVVESDGTKNYGSVSYLYNIDKYDVTVGQYTSFLNAVATTGDPYGLYDSLMATDKNSAGIAQSGSTGHFTYSVIGSANHPVTYVEWGDAARFANWLANGQPTGAEGIGTTETGSYTLNGAQGSALDAINRNANATWVLPNENEWYKAAYYKPSTSTYYQYPFSSSTAPTSAAPNSTPNTGNFYDPTTGYAVTHSTSSDSNQNYLTDVGAYTASASPYGLFDMGGDVYQWTEALVSGIYRGERGGSWSSFSFTLASSYRNYIDPTLEVNNEGFRVAAVLLPGDLNRDGHVDSKDITAMMQALTNEAGYAQSSGLTVSQISALGDVNNDGKFNNADLQTLLNNLKSGGGSADPVPEPSSAVLALSAFTCCAILYWTRLVPRQPRTC
jgi:formylglycine-generating enzyme